MRILLDNYGLWRLRLIALHPLAADGGQGQRM